MAMEMTGSGKEMFSSINRLGIAQRIAGEALFETKHRANIPGTDFGHIFAVIGMHTDQTTNAFLLALGGVHEQFVPGSDTPE